MTNEAAVLRGVQKRYKDFTLGPLDLTIPTGTIVGLVGENGAGKTTTLKLLCGVNPADAGEITLLAAAPPTPRPGPGWVWCLRTPTFTAD